MTETTSTDTRSDDTPYRSIWTWLRSASFSQRWIDVDGISTRIVDAGDPTKPALVALHGTGGHWEAFAPNLEALSEHFHFIGIDMIGNGFTDKPDYGYEIPVYVGHVARTMDLLGVERASFVGISLGAWVAARFAQQHPERTDKVILMSPAGLLASKEKMERIKRQRTAAVDGADWESIHAVFAHLIADERNRIPDIIAVRQAVYARPDTRDTIQHLLVLQDYQVRTRNLLTEDEWRQITAPVMVIASGKDFAEYQSTARQIITLMPNSTLLEMPHVGHWPSFEDPELFNREALAFLKGGQ